jgi:hypothetical protein
MTTSCAEAILLVGISCQVVPTVMASAPASTTRSIFVRIAIHLAAIGLFVAACEYSDPGPMRTGLIALALLAPIQYWMFVVLERAFERRYQREPVVSALIRRFDMKLEDRFMSLACAGLGLGLGVVAAFVTRAFCRLPL